MFISSLQSAVMYHPYINNSHMNRGGRGKIGAHIFANQPKSIRILVLSQNNF